MKTRSSKSRKIAIILKGLTHGFCTKMAIFPSSFFQAIWGRKMFFTIFQSKKTPFQAKKTKNSKGQKLDIFPIWLTHGFGPKMAIFSTFFFLGSIGQENFFYDILERKNAFLAYKNKKFKKQKNCHLSKGLTHGFCPKVASFPTSFFRQFRPSKCLLRYSRTKKRLSRL